MSEGKKKNISEEIERIKHERERLKIEEMLTIKKALSSDDPDAIMRANVRWKDLEPREDSGTKSLLFDPYQFAQGSGYKGKNQAISYDTLRRMAKTPIIRSIINTRVEQVAAFSEPQSDKHAIGFTIRKKSSYDSEDKDEVSDQEKEQIAWITDFMLNCGTIQNAWHGDSFDTFLRKIVRDSLEIDQMTFEVVRNRAGVPVEFLATDGATYRFADSYDDDAYVGSEKEQVNGYYPSYVQIHDDTVLTDFYPWELCMGIRNHQTNIDSNGYGRAELEDIIQIVTWMLYGDSYNGKFFSQGSAPKGILKISGNVNNTRLAEFRQQWQSMVQGVGNSHKTPVIESDKMEWIDMQKSNRDMEFQKWQEYLIQVSCAIFKISPEEIGMDVSGSGGTAMIDNSSNETKLQFSRDKGLRPLLKFVERKINKYIINAIDPNYEFVFAGIDVDTEANELELDIKKVSNFMGYKEMRKKYGLSEELEEGDIILNPIFSQMQMQSMMGDADSDAAMMDEYGDEEMGAEGEMDAAAPTEDPNQPYTLDDEDEWSSLLKSDNSNPLIKGLNDFLNDEIYKK